MLRRALRWLDSTNQEVIMTLNENAAIVLAALGRCALPHQFAIAGGYARDLFFGVMPKDIDVIVVGHVDPTALVVAMKEHGYLPDRADGASGEASTWKEVLQFSCPGKLDVDVLVSYEASVLQAIDTFDCNLNQFILWNGEPSYLGGGNAVLRFTGRQISDDRRAYIEQKARDLGWIVPVTPVAELPPLPSANKE